MKIDWDAFNRLSDAEKVAFLKEIEDAALKEAEGKTYPPGSIAPEKARYQEGSVVIGHENPDGTVHYYADDETPSGDDAATDEDDRDGQDT